MCLIRLLAPALENGSRNGRTVGGGKGRQARMLRSVSPCLQRLETRDKQVVAAHPAPHTICFIPVDKKVVSTYEMAAGRNSNRQRRAEFEPMI
jgi:hypothetical protein